MVIANAKSKMQDVTMDIKEIKQTVDSMKDSRQHVVGSRGAKGFLSTIYYLLSTWKSAIYYLLSTKRGLLSTERGIALSIVLILSVIALAIMAGLIYMLTAGTQISGMQKRYKTAVEAGVGGAGISYEFIATRGAAGIYTFSPGITAECRTLKLNQSTANWGIGTTCPVNSNSLAINPADNTSYDWTLQLGAAPDPVYTVYSKIVDTVEGNSGGDEGLIKGGVVSAGAGEVAVVSRPYLYTIEIDAQNADNPAERAKLSVLYQY